MITLPNPECPLGFPETQLIDFMTDLQLRDFHAWMYGQTFSHCDGRFFNHTTRQYEQSPCFQTTHGWVFFPTDVIRFLSGRKVID